MHWPHFPGKLQAQVLACLPLPALQLVSKVPLVKKLAFKVLSLWVKLLLERWSLPPTLTMQFMRRHQVVLSGSAALEVVLPDTCHPRNLDFYCPAGDFCQTLLYFYEQGYKLLLKTKRSTYATISPAIRCLAVMYRSDSGQEINIMESTSSSLVAPILFFHSTCVMNFISANGVTCFYPTLTFQRKGKLPKSSKRVALIRM